MVLDLLRGRKHPRALVVVKVSQRMATDNVDAAEPVATTTAAEVMAVGMVVVARRAAEVKRMVVAKRATLAQRATVA